VFASHSDSAGVVLIRFPANRRSTLAQSILQLVREHKDELQNAFVVIQPVRFDLAIRNNVWQTRRRFVVVLVFRGCWE